MNRKVFALAAAIAIALLPTAARADDWPQYRGPARDNVWRETGIVESFPPGGLKPAWRVEGGPGFASPVVGGDFVYLFHSALADGKAFEKVRCFEAATGKPVWTHAYAAAYKDWALDPKYLAGPNATPVIHLGKIYALGQAGDLHCLNAKTGDVHWRRDLAKDYEMKDFAGTPSPLIEGELLILVIGGKPGATVLALDKATGKEAWRALDEPPTHSSPMVIDASGRRQLIVWTQQSVTALDPAAGKTLWRQALPTMGDYAVATPVCEKNRLLIGGLMLDLPADKPGASVLWPDSKAQTKRIFSNTSTALVQGDHLYSARSTGELICVETATGNPLWENKAVTDGANGASIHLTPCEGAVFLYTNQGELIRAKLTPKGYEETARSKILEPTHPFGGRKVAWPPPAYAGRRVFVRSDAEMVCVSLAKP